MMNSHMSYQIELRPNLRQNLTPNETRNPGDDRWIIGQNGVNRSNIWVIGAIHVSAGSWMPILQLNTYVLY